MTTNSENHPQSLGTLKKSEHFQSEVDWANAYEQWMNKWIEKFFKNIFRGEIKRTVFALKLFLGSNLNLGDQYFDFTRKAMARDAKAASFNIRS